MLLFKNIKIRSQSTRDFVAWYILKGSLSEVVSHLEDSGRKFSSFRVDLSTSLQDDVPFISRSTFLDNDLSFGEVFLLRNIY